MSNLVTLQIGSIRHRPDARHRSDGALSALAESIEAIGLINPIRVRAVGDSYEVVAGSHRLQACELVGLSQVECIVVDDDDLHAELAMIDENLVRAELSPSERAQQTARRKAIYETLHPEAKHGQNIENTPSGQFVHTETPSFATATAKTTGRDERSVRRDAERGEKVNPEAMDLLRGTKLDTGTYLDRIKRLSPNEQVHAVKRALAWEKKRDEEPKPKGGVAGRYQPALERPTGAKMFESFIAMIDAIEAVPVADLIASAGRQRAVLGQRASGLADRMSEIMEGLGR